MLVGSAIRRVAIVGGVRIPFARAYSAYATATNQDMLTATLRALVERFKLQGERLGDVAAGAGRQRHGQVADLEQLTHDSRTALAVRGSSASRNVSPMKLNASTTVRIARPGNRPTHQSLKF